MDRKFQSALPGGNVRSVQVIKSNGKLPDSNVVAADALF